MPRTPSPRRNMGLTSALFAPRPAAAPATNAGALSDWRSELAGLLRGAKERQDVDTALRLASGAAGGGAAAPALPAPASVQDLIALSRESRESNGTIATAARQELADERERRREAEAAAEKARDAGRREAEAQHATALDILKSAGENQQKLLEKVTELTLESEKSRNQAELAEVRARLDGMEQRHKIELDHKDEEIVRLRTQNQQLSQKRSLHEELSDAALDPEYREQLRTLAAPILGLQGTAQIQDPDLAFKNALAPEMAQVVVLSAKQKLRNQARTQKGLDQLISAGAGALNVLRVLGAKFAGVPLSALTAGGDGAEQEETDWPEEDAEEDGGQ